MSFKQSVTKALLTKTNNFGWFSEVTYEQIFTEPTIFFAQNNQKVNKVKEVRRCCNLLKLYFACYFWKTRKNYNYYKSRHGFLTIVTLSTSLKYHPN